MEKINLIVGLCSFLSAFGILIVLIRSSDKENDI